MGDCATCAGVAAFSLPLTARRHCHTLHALTDAAASSMPLKARRHRQMLAQGWHAAGWQISHPGSRSDLHIAATAAGARPQHRSLTESFSGDCAAAVACSWSASMLADCAVAGAGSGGATSTTSPCWASTPGHSVDVSGSSSHCRPWNRHGQVRHVVTAHPHNNSPTNCDFPSCVYANARTDQSSDLLCICIRSNTGTAAPAARAATAAP